MRSVSTSINSLTVFKGGAKIKDIRPMVENKVPSVDVNQVKSVTLCVGTNNLTDRKPLYQIINEYVDLVTYLSNTFPRARIGLFNVPPRFYSSIELLIRIRAFNNSLLDLTNFYKNVEVIKVYWQFINPRGYPYMNVYLYKHDFLHFSESGVLMVKDYISSFQHGNTIHYCYLFANNKPLL